jgi:predicted Zn-dependent peptidase
MRISRAWCAWAFVLAPAVLAQVRLPPYERVALDNGAVIFLLPHHEVPIVSFEALLRGGTVAEPADRQGVAALTASLLGRGAGTRNAREFVDAVADVGGSFSASPGVEALRVRGEFLAAHRKLMVDLLADVLIRPRFDPLELDKVKLRAVELIRSAKDSDAQGVLGLYGTAFLFGEHPYGRPIGGDEEGLARVMRDDVVRYYAEQAGADRLLLVVAGDFDPKEMKRLLSGALEEMPEARAPLPPTRAPQKVQTPRVLLVDKPGATQTYFWIGDVGVSRSYAAHAALELVDTAFGGSFTSMLNTELRVRTGLTYGAGSSVSQPSEPGYVAISSYTRTDSTVQAIDLALATLGRLHEQGLDAEQLASTKQYLLGQYPLGLETAGQLAAQVAVVEFFGLGRRYIDDFTKEIDAVDLAQARRTIAEVYPSPDKLVYVLIGDASAIREQVAKYGPVTEMPITAPRFAPQ